MQKLYTSQGPSEYAFRVQGAQQVAAVGYKRVRLHMDGDVFRVRGYDYQWDKHKQFFCLNFDSLDQARACWEEVVQDNFGEQMREALADSRYTVKAEDSEFCYVARDGHNIIGYYCPYISAVCACADHLLKYNFETRTKD